MADKGIAKASTIAIKYFLRHIFLISTGEDADATERTENGDKNQQPPDTRPYEHQLADKLAFMTDHHAHTVNIIIPLLEAGMLKPDDPLHANAIKVMYHRALDKFEMDEDGVIAILTAEIDGCTGLIDWLTNHKRPLSDAWELIVAAHELKGDKRATPKNGKATAQNPLKQSAEQTTLPGTPKVTGQDAVKDGGL